MPRLNHWRNFLVVGTLALTIEAIVLGFLTGELLASFLMWFIMVTFIIVHALTMREAQTNGQA